MEKTGETKISFVALQNLVDALHHCRHCVECGESGCHACSDCTADAALAQVKTETGVE